MARRKPERRKPDELSVDLWSENLEDLFDAPPELLEGHDPEVSPSEGNAESEVGEGDKWVRPSRRKKETDDD